MTLRLAIALVLASPLLASCFRPDLTCLPCQKTLSGSLTCMENHCVEFEGQVNFCKALTGDASPGPDTAPDGPDAGPGPITGGVCADRCCVGGSCLEFSTPLQRGLLLWADRTSLPPVGHIVERWRDRSPKGNDIVNVNFGKGPRVQLDDVGPIAEIDEGTMVMATRPVRRSAWNSTTSRS